MGVEEILLTGTRFDQRERGDSQHFHNTGKLFDFVLPGENGISRKELAKDAPERPHIDRAVVWETQNNLRSSVEAGLDVTVDPLVDKTGRPKIDDLDSRFHGCFQENVLWFHITVDDFVVVEKAERIQQLDRESPNE
jgi:hypothetical protein